MRTLLLLGLLLVGCSKKITVQDLEREAERFSRFSEDCRTIKERIHGQDFSVAVGEDGYHCDVFFPRGMPIRFFYQEVKAINRFFYVEGARLKWNSK